MKQPTRKQQGKDTVQITHAGVVGLPSFWIFFVMVQLFCGLAKLTRPRAALSVEWNISRWLFVGYVLPEKDDSLVADVGRFA